jgi:NADPH:quinone reductase-like Zn-dependent oxidoreductase
MLGDITVPGLFGDGTKAIVQDVYGSADVIEQRDVDRPLIGNGEVLVRVRAAGLDPSVWHLMTGEPYLCAPWVRAAPAQGGGARP